MMNFYKVYILLVTLLFVSNWGYAVDISSNPVSVDNRIKTFVYSDNEVFTVVLNYGYTSYIEFSKGETVKYVSMGNSSNWHVKPLGNKLFISPLELHGCTNMFVETNKGRSYSFDLVGTPDGKCSQTAKLDVVDNVENLNTDYSLKRDLAYVVRFFYPKTQDEFDLNDVKIPKLSSPTQVYGDEQPSDIVKINDSRYNYTYVASEDSDDIVPTELFDDSNLTYLKFGNSEIIPKVFTKDKFGRENPLKMLKFEGYIVVKGVYKDLAIRYKNKYVEIKRRS